LILVHCGNIAAKIEGAVVVISNTKNRDEIIVINEKKIII